MAMKPCPIACSLILAATLATPLFVFAKADCVVVKDDMEAAFHDADVVFSGSVARIDTANDRLGFRVDRVWKGPVSREMWIYQLGSPSVESHEFQPEPEIKYIIFAHQLSSGDRKFRVKADEPAFGVSRSCGEGPRWTQEHARELDRIAKRIRTHK
jgi:hypothetical protein